MERRLYVDGERVRSDAIPHGEVQSFLRQIGGSGSDEAPGEAPLNLKVRDQSGDELIFRVKKNTPMKKIFEAYAQRIGVAVAALKFTYDGNRVKDEDTPKMLELDDNDQIDVFLNQTGGADEEGGAAVKSEEAAITIKVTEASGDEIAFKVKKSTKMAKIMEAFAQRKGVASNMLRFMVDGKRVNAEDTPKTLELEDGDQVDVVLQQEGGK